MTREPHGSEGSVARRFAYTARTALFSISLLALLAAAAQTQQITLEARWLDVGLQPLPGEISVPDLDCDSPSTPSTNVCLQVRCDPCTTPIPDLGDAVRNASLTAADLLSLLGTSVCTIRDVNVALELTHSFVGDLIVDFDRLAITGSTLYFPPGSCAATDVDALFDDESTRAPDACPATGGLSYRPGPPSRRSMASRPLATTG